MNLNINGKLAFNGGTKYKKIRTQNAPLIGGGYEHVQNNNLSKREEQNQAGKLTVR